MSSKFWWRRFQLPARKPATTRPKLGQTFHELEVREVPASWTLSDSTHGVLGDLRTLDPNTAGIDPNKPVWVVIHGRNSSATSEGTQLLANTIKNARATDQVLLVDWSDKAGNAVSASQDNWVKPVGQAAAAMLQTHGVSGSRVNLVGHSWGSYVAAELAESMPGATVNSILAIDPGMNGFGTKYNPETNGEVDFKRNSNWSWAFFESGGDPLGSTVTPLTADEQFVVRNSGHSDTRDVVSNLLNPNTSPALTAPFRLDRLMAGTPYAGLTLNSFTATGASLGGAYDAVVDAGLSGTTAYRLRYVDGSGKSVNVLKPGATVQDYQGLRFESEGSLTSGPVRFGLTPADGRSFTPLAKFEGGVSFANDTNGTFTGQGSVSALLAGTSFVVVPGGPNTYSASGIIGDDQNFDLSFPTVSVNLASVNLEVSGVSLSYSPNDRLSLAGTGSATFAGQTVSVQVGTKANPGIVFQDGELESVNVKLESSNSSLNFPGVTIAPSPTGLSIGYASKNRTFAITGGATATFANQTVGVQLGDATSPGLVISDGRVTSLDLKVTGDLNIGAVKFVTDSDNGLRLTYAKTTDTVFTLTGGATASIGGQSVGVNFGGNGSKGLVIKNGTMTDLNVNLTSSISAAGVSIQTTGLGMSYAAPSSATSYLPEYTIYGGAKIAVSGQDVAITLGDAASPGLKIRGGQVHKVDAAVTGKIAIGGLNFEARQLRVQYDRLNATSFVRITGGTAFAFAGQSIAVKFGGDAESRGLEFDNAGTLSYLDMSVTADFNLKGISFGVNDLAIQYNPVGSKFQMSGSVYVSTGGTGTGKTLNRMTATLGTPANPGLVIANGELDRLNIGVDGSFNLFGVTLATNKLAIEYTKSDGVLAFSGGVTVQLTNQIRGGVSLPYRGLTINTQSGQVQLNGLTLTFDAKFGAFAVEDLKVSYLNTNGNISISASGMVSFPGGFSVGGNFAIANGKLTDIGFQYDAGSTTGIPLGSTGLYLTSFGGSLQNLDEPEDIIVSANAGVTFGKSVRFNGQNYALFTADGKLEVSAKYLKLSGEIKLLGGLLGRGSASLDLNWSTGVYSASVTNIPLFAGGLFTLSGSFTFTKIGDITIRATVDARVPEVIPVIGGMSLGQAGFYMQLRPNDDDGTNDYAAAWVKLPVIGTAGFKVDFDGHFSLLNGAGVAALGTEGEYENVDGSGYYNYFYDITVPENVSAVRVTVRSPVWGIRYPVGSNQAGQPIFGASEGEFIGLSRFGGGAGTGIGGPYNIQPGANPESWWQSAANDGVDGRVVSRAVAANAALTPGLYRVRVRSKVPLTGDNAPQFSEAFIYRQASIQVTDVTVDPYGTARIAMAPASYTPESWPTNVSNSSEARIRLYYDETPDGSAANPNGYDGTQFAEMPYSQLQGMQVQTKSHYDWWGLYQLAPQPYAARPVYVYAVLDDGRNEQVFSNYSAAVTPVDPVPAVVAPAAIITNFSQPVSFAGSNTIGISAPTLEVHMERVDLTVSADVGQLQYGTEPAQQTLRFNRITFAEARQFLQQIRHLPPANFTGQARVTVTVGSQLNEETFVGEGVVVLTPPTANLAVTVASNQSDVIPGDAFTLTATVTNQAVPGGQTATAVRVNAPLPTGLNFVSADGTYDPATGVWTVGDLPVGASRTLRLTVTAARDAGGWGLSPSVSVIPNALPDFDEMDNQASDFIAVRSPILVDTTADIVDLADGKTSLREAINLANVIPGRDLIRFGVTGDLPLYGTMNVTDPVRIEGPGAPNLWLVGAVPGERVFTFNSSNAELVGVTVNGNGIANSGTLLVSDVEFVNNFVAGPGGGIVNTGTLTVDRSTFVANQAKDGGALANRPGATATIRNSTLYLNNATTGGAIRNDGTLTIVQSTIAGNTATSSGGGVIGNGSTRLENTIVAGNTAPTAPDVSGLGVGDFNLIGNANGSSGWTATNLLNRSAQLGSLGTNGGSTRTMMPLVGSPAIDAGPNASTLATDQRGESRLVNFRTDIGAVEVPLGRAVSYTVTNLPSAVVTDQVDFVTVTALDAYGRPAGSGTVTLTSSDPLAILPPTYTFRNGDLGTVALPITFRTPGTHTVTVTGTRPGSPFVWTSPATPVIAQNLVVTTANDVLDPNDGLLSLREAVDLANFGIGSNRITFNTTGLHEITNGSLTISDDLEIDGAVTLSGSNRSRIFDVTDGDALTLRRLTLTGGRPGATESGGLIVNHGTLVVRDAVLDSSGGTTGYARNGGGLMNWGLADIEGSVLGGVALGSGGGIANAGTLAVRNSRIFGGSASYGGGLYNSGTASLVNTTVSGNSASYGGGVFSNGNLTVDDSTVAANTATHNAGGLQVASGTASLAGTIVARNGFLTVPNITAGPSRDVAGTVTSAGYNLIGIADGSSGWKSTDLRGTGSSPLDAKLVSHGNAWIPQPGSPAVDANDPVDSTTVDQLRQPRRIGGRSDIGAYEVQPGYSTHLVMSIAPGYTNLAGDQMTYRVTLKDAYGHTPSVNIFSVRFSSSDPLATLPGIDGFDRDAAGNLSFRAVLRTAGTQTITLIDQNNNNAVLATSSVTVRPQIATRYAVTGMPATVTAGTSIPLTVTAYDVFNNVATEYRGNVDVTSNDPKFAPFRVYFDTAAAGIVRMNVMLRTAGQWTLKLADTIRPTLTATTSPIKVTPAAFAGYAITNAPTTIRLNQLFSLDLTAVDAFGNRVTNYLGTTNVKPSTSSSTGPQTVSFGAAQAGLVTKLTFSFGKIGRQWISFTDQLTGKSTVFAFDVWA